MRGSNLRKDLSPWTALVGLALASVAVAQPLPTNVYSEGFNNGCTSNCLASSYGSWSVVDNVDGVTGSSPNNWFVSCSEDGVTPPGCGSTCVGDATLHIGGDPGSGGDMSATFNETGAANATYRLARSPTINATGRSNLFLQFDFIAYGSAACSDDRAQLRLSTDNGATWPAGFQYCLTSVCCGACNGYSQGQWTKYTLALPPAFNNNPNIRIGFHWRNNGNGSGTNPAVAIDDVRVGACDSSVCSNHGTCGFASFAPPGTLACTCDPGYRGDACQFSDAVTCNGHGVAQANGSCVCATGFGDAGCDQCATDYFNYPTCTFCDAGTTCAGHGTCSPSGGCQCSAGFAGAFCQYSNAGTCNGHGTAQVDGGCACSTGFADAGCGECASDHFGYPACTFCSAATTCSAHGTCNSSGGCACASGYAGPACQYSDMTTCSGHGVAQTNGSCVCAIGFEGATCGQCATGYFSYPTCRFCNAGTTCNGQGSCTSAGGCACQSGFAGAGCQFSDAVTCSGHGAALADGGCSCATGFEGGACAACAANHFNYPTCTFCSAATTCSSNGICNSSGGCACSSGFAGSACQFGNSTTCNAQGVAQEDGGCVCSLNIEGTQCERCVTGRMPYPECLVPDAGQPDAGPRDAGMTDGGGVDAGFVDAGLADAGVVDAGTVDAGGVDDAGLADAGFADAGPADAGPADAGPADAGDLADADAGTLVDAGEPSDGGMMMTPKTGCGCTSFESTSTVLLAVAALVSRRRRGALAAGP